MGFGRLARHLAPVCLLFLAWGTLVLMFTFSLGPGSFNPAIYWMFFFLGPLLHSYSSASDLMGFRHRTVVLEPFTCPKRVSEAIVLLLICRTCTSRRSRPWRRGFHQGRAENCSNSNRLGPTKGGLYPDLRRPY